MVDRAKLTQNFALPAQVFPKLALGKTILSLRTRYDCILLLAAEVMSPLVGGKGGASWRLVQDCPGNGAWLVLTEEITVSQAQVPGPLTAEGGVRTTCWFGICLGP